MVKGEGTCPCESQCQLPYNLYVSMPSSCTPYYECKCKSKFYSVLQHMSKRIYKVSKQVHTSTSFVLALICVSTSVSNVDVLFCFLHFYCAAHAQDRVTRQDEEARRTHESGRATLLKPTTTAREQTPQKKVKTDQPIFKNSAPFTPVSNSATGRPLCPTKRKTLQEGQSEPVGPRTIARPNSCEPSKLTKDFRATQISCRKLAHAFPWP